MRRPSIHQLEVFRKVVELESMARAAEEFRVAPSSVSMQIQELEKRFRASLLVRGPRRTVPTAAGRILYARAVTVLDNLDAAERELTKLSELESGVLAFATGRTIGAAFVRSVLQTFERTYPKIDVSYHVMANSQQAAAEVLDGRAEFALIGRTHADGVLEVTPLFQEPLLLVVAPQHPLATMDGITKEVLCTFRLLLRESPVLGRDGVIASLAETGLPPQVVELGSTEALRARALAGDGAAVLPQTLVKDELADGSLVSVAVQAFRPTRTVHLITLSNTPLSPPADTFITLLRDRYSPAD